MNILDVFEYNQHFVAMMNVINVARFNPPKEGHKHHIIPRCWFRMNNLPIDNSKDNLVLLSKEQHSKIHKLMSLCAKDEQIKRNMILAAHLMGLPATSLKYTPTDETRKKMSEAQKGRTFSDETRRKLSAAHKGLHLSEEHRRKIGESNKGRIVTEETRRKISESQKGRPLSEEHYRNICEANKKVTEDKCRKISEALKGMPSWNKGKATSIFGKSFKEHYGITSCDDIKLYRKEYNFYNKYNKFSWEVK